MHRHREAGKPFAPRCKLALTPPLRAKALYRVWHRLPAAPASSPLSSQEDGKPKSLPGGSSCRLNECNFFSLVSDSSWLPGERQLQSKRLLRGRCPQPSRPQPDGRSRCRPGAPARSHTGPPAAELAALQEEILRGEILGSRRETKYMSHSTAAVPAQHPLAKPPQRQLGPNRPHPRCRGGRHARAGSDAPERDLQQQPTKSSGIARAGLWCGT